MSRLLALLVLAGIAAGAAQAQSGSSGRSGSSAFCDRTQPLSAAQQDRLLRFAAVVQGQIDDGDNRDGAVALISRSGLDLSRFHIRYSHSAIAWREDTGAWSARQLYFACEERRPRIYDQGLAGFALGMDEPLQGYISIIRLPAEAGRQLRRATLDNALALHLVGASYSANAYPFSLLHQNCNQWVMEMLAVAWGGLPDGDDLRDRAQRWLREAQYAPAPVEVDSNWVMLAALFMPYLHLDDHPTVDRLAMKIKVSLPATVEAFARERLPASERIEVCHAGPQVVVHHGWTSIADGCRPAPGDQVISLD